MNKICNKLISVVLDRKAIVRGFVFAVAYMAIDTIGFIFLIRSVSLQQGDLIAGRISLVLYVLAFASVCVNSLGVVVSREVARLSACSEYDGHDLEVVFNIEKYFLAFIFLVAIISSVFMSIYSEFTILPGVILSVGFAIRSFGLLSAFERVGLGNIGADKSFMLVFSVCFYLFSIIFIRFVFFGIHVVEYSYALAGVLSCLPYFSRLKSGIKKIFKDARLMTFPGLDSARKVEYKEFLTQFFSLLITSVSGYFVINGDVFVVSSIIGPEALVSYSIAAKMGLGVYALASIYSSMQIQPIAKNFKKNNLTQCYAFWKEGVLVAMMLSISISVVLVLIYPIVLRPFIGNMEFLDRKIVTCLCISASVLALTSASGWAILGSIGPNALVKPTVFDAVFTILFGVLGAVLFNITGLIYGVILSHILSAWWHMYIAFKLFSVYENQ